MPFSENSDSKYSEEDFLEVDAVIPGQNYVCISMVSPEDVIKRKETYLVKNIIRNVKFEESETSEKIDEKIENYLCLNKDKIEKEYHEHVDFKTSVRGIKVRGVYDSLKEAQHRAKLVQKLDRNHNIFIGQVGYWLPIDGDPNTVENSEYLESELNELMKNYKDNSEKRDQFYAEQVNRYKESKSTTKHEMHVEDVTGVEESKESVENVATVEEIFNSENIKTSSEKVEQV